MNDKELDKLEDKLSELGENWIDVEDDIRTTAQEARQAIEELRSKLLECNS